MHAKKLLSLLLSALAAVTLLASCGSRWDYSREGVKAANEAQGETLRVEFQIDQKFTNALHDAVEENIQPADVEKAMLADASLKELLTSGYRLNVYALRADVDAEEAARTIAEEQILPRLSGCKDEGIISMVKADNNYFYEAVLTYKESSSGGGGGSEPGKPDDKPEEPVNQYTVTVVTLPEGEDLGTVTPSATEVEEGGEVTFTVEPNDDVTVVSITAQVGEAEELTYDYAEGAEYTISDIHGNVIITVKFEKKPWVTFDNGKTLTLWSGADEHIGTTLGGVEGGSEQADEKIIEEALKERGDLLQDDTFSFADVQKLVIKNDSGITNVGQAAFSGDGNYQPLLPTTSKTNNTLQSIELYGVKNIDISAFRLCTALTTISLPDVEEIEEGAFLGCIGLTDINIHLKGKSVVKKQAFLACTGLTTVDIKTDGDLTIESWVFGKCTNLQSADLEGQNITIIAIAAAEYDDLIVNPRGAFIDCTSLQTVTLNGNLKEIGKYTFGETTELSMFEKCNETVTIKCTGGVEAFKKACPDPNDPTKVGLSSWEQVQSI